jgi:hypothetical protein
VERPHGLKRAEHAERAVELAPGRLRVEMRAHRDWRETIVPSRPPREHVADFVDRDSAAERLALRLEPIADPAIEVSQRQPADAALWRAANLRRLHQRVPKPLGINLQILQRQASPKRHDLRNCHLNQAARKRDWRRQ